MAFVIPLLMMLMFGAFQIARVFYVYQALQKSLRGGAGLLARSTNENYCDPTDQALLDARNFMVYGNIQGSGTPVVNGLTIDAIQIFPERVPEGTSAVNQCSCGDADSCDVLAGGRAPDFITVNLGNGFPLEVPFPFVRFSTLNLRASVRMPVTGQ